MNKNELKELYPKMSEQFMETVNKSVSEGLKDNGKVIKMKKRIFTVLAATFLIGVSVYASGRAVGVLSTSNSLTEFTDADEFKNGYMFKKGWITNSSGIDENGVKLDDSKELTMVYSKNENDMYLIVGPNNTDDGTADREITASSQMYKNLPVDYEMTEQDIEDQNVDVHAVPQNFKEACERIPRMEAGVQKDTDCRSDEQGTVNFFCDKCKQNCKQRRDECPPGSDKH